MPKLSLIILIIKSDVSIKLYLTIEIDLKNDTLKKFNDVTYVHYQKNKEKIVKIKEEFL